jgi:HK97 family phage major capsid protein
MGVEMKDIESALGKLEERVELKLNDIKSQTEESGSASKRSLADLESMLGDHKDLAGIVDGLKSTITDIQQKQTKLPAGGDKPKSMGDQFFESDSFKAFKSGQSTKASFEVKATLINSGNDTSRHAVLDGVQGAAFRRLTVMPTLDQATTDSNIIYFPRETTWTNTADGQGTEGTTKAESTLIITEQNEPVITIAHFLPVSKQALDDSSFLSAFLNRRMTHGVNNAVEQQVISGLTASGELSGWADSGNSTVTAPASTGNIFGLANKMKLEIELADYEPAFYYMNPTDFSTMETIQRGTGDAAYVAASGALNYVNQGMTLLLWGLPVVKSNNVPAGTMYCKAREADMFASRMGTVLEMSESDSDNFQKNLVTVRAETRGALLNFAPAAIRSGIIANIT